MRPTIPCSTRTSRKILCAWAMNGAFAVLTSAIVPRLIGRVDLRVLVSGAVAWMAGVAFWRAHFTTDNLNTPPQSIVVTLKDGPFRHLHGEWRFRALSEHGCKVEFELAYEFTTHLLERVVGPVFSHIADSFIDAFVRRAEALHPERQ